MNTKISKYYYVAAIIRICVLLLITIPVIYSLFQIYSGNMIDDIAKEWTIGIAAYAFWFLILPSIIIVLMLSIKFVYAKWVVLCWDIIFVIGVIIHFNILLFYVIPFTLLEIASLFYSPINND